MIAPVAPGAIVLMCSMTALLSTQSFENSQVEFHLVGVSGIGGSVFFPSLSMLESRQAYRRVFVDLTRFTKLRIVLMGSAMMVIDALTAI